MRGDSTMNISEVIIMLRTIIQSMGKVFPQANFFKDCEVLDEIKPAMFTIFQEYIEKQISREKEGQSMQKGMMTGETSNLGFIGFSKKMQQLE
jgi:hypothetical protein